MNIYTLNLTVTWWTFLVNSNSVLVKVWSQFQRYVFYIWLKSIHRIKIHTHKKRLPIKFRKFDQEFSWRTRPWWWVNLWIHLRLKCKKKRKEKQKFESVPLYRQVLSILSKIMRQVGSSSTTRTRRPAGNGSELDDPPTTPGFSISPPPVERRKIHTKFETKKRIYSQDKTKIWEFCGKKWNKKYFIMLVGRWVDEMWELKKKALAFVSPPLSFKLSRFLSVISDFFFYYSVLITIF